MGAPTGRGIASRPRLHILSRLIFIGLLVLVLVEIDFTEIGRKSTFKHLFTPGDAEVIDDTNGNQINIVRHVVLRVNDDNEQLEHSEVHQRVASGTEILEANHTSKDLIEVHGKEQFLYRGAPWKQEVGRWFDKCGHVSEPIQIVEEIPDKNCPQNCLRNGVCNRELGECRCRSGYNGTNCRGFDDHPCNLDPVSLGAPPARWIVSLCPAFCDNRTAQCICGPGSAHPHRPLLEPCGITRTDKGRVYNAENQIFLYGNTSEKMGWCNADQEKVRRGEQKSTGTCGCAIDGRDGMFCDEYTRAYCLGGCNSHGSCFSGYCECNDGWYGIDCSIPSTKTKTPYQYTPPWLRLEANEENSLVQEPSTKLLEVQGKATMFSPEKENFLSARKFKGSKKTIKVRRVMRRRPLIYIYDLPGDFTFHHYEGRQIRSYCVPWMYNPRNETIHLTNQLYGMEPVVLEGLLASPHRTTNPDEADYFYVPILTGCILARADDSPRLDMLKRFNSRRPYLTMNYTMQAFEYIRDNYPFWNRSGGHDHIWMFPWDEGACYAPEAIWNSTMLSPWGNTMAHHNYSTTAYGYDEWDQIPKSLRGSHPCFDPVKDIVMPNWKTPNVQLVQERLWARPFEQRSKLFYFNGNLGLEFHLGRPEENYSMGIRQKVAKYFASSPNKDNKLGELHEDGVVVSNQRSPSYSQELSSSKFCGVFPGDGFSARMEDSILHGCIPVIIQDGIQMAFENVLEYSEFAVRILEDDIPAMIKILKGISKSEVQSKLAAIQGFWQRWTYSSVFQIEAARQQEWHGHESFWGQEYAKLTEDDAMGTLLQVLHYKLYNDPWRKSKLGKKLRRHKNLGLQCRE